MLEDKYVLLNLLFYVLFISYCVQEPTDEITDDIMLRFSTQCIKETKVEPDVVLKLKPDQRLKIWAQCMKSKIKPLVQDFGTYSKSLIIEDRLFTIHHINPSNIKCELKETDLRHRRDWEYLECYNDENPKQYIHLGNKSKELETRNKETRNQRKKKLHPWFLSEAGRKAWHYNVTLKLFPEDDPNSDRIINQLMYHLKRGERVRAKKIFLTKKYERISPGRVEFIKDSCPVYECILTWENFETADAVLFDHWKTTTDIFLRIRNRPPNQIWIYYTEESPYYTNRVRPMMLDQINWTASYRQDADIVTPSLKWVLYDSQKTQKDQDVNYAGNKTKKVAWFVSNCQSFNNHRMEYAMELAKFIPVDVYGMCGRNYTANFTNWFEMLRKEYKFYLAFENANCQDYISEKLFKNALLNNVVPVVMGARRSEYASVAPHNSYIHVEDFKGPEELAAYLHRLDTHDPLYNSYFKWKGTGEFIETHFFCRLCAMLHANSQHRRRNAHYTNVEAWIRRGMCTNQSHLWSSLSDGRRRKKKPM